MIQPSSLEMSTIDTPRPLAFRREFHHDLICNPPRSGLIPLYSTNSIPELASSFKFPSRPSSTQEAQVSTSPDLKHDSITTQKPKHDRELTITNPKPCLVIVCVTCKKSTAWFSPPAPQSQPLVDPHADDHGSDGSNDSSNILNTHSSTSSLNNSISNHATSAPTPSAVLLDQSSLPLTPHQPHKSSLAPNPPSISSPLFPPTSKNHVAAPTWISGQIHGICSECQSASQSSAGLDQTETFGDVLSHSSKPHPVSFFSDATPMSASSCSSDSFPSSTSIPLEFDDADDNHSLASSPSSAQVISVASVKPFRLSFPEVVSMRQRNLKPPTPPEFPELDNLDGSRHSPDHVIKLDLPPRRRARRGTSPADVLHPKDMLETVAESPSPARNAVPESAPEPKSETPQRRSPPIHPADKGASLRSLLRQTKIPPSTHSSPFHHGHLRNASDIWEAALVGTPLEPRGMAPPSWQTYMHTRSEERVHHHRGASTSSNMSSYHHSSSSHGFATSRITASDSNADEPIVAKASLVRLPSSNRSSPPNLMERPGPLRRRPSLRIAVTDSQISEPARQESNHTPESQKPPSRSASRTKRPATAATVTPASHSLLRQNSSHGLFGRFVSNPLKEFKRRPNTATGSSTHGAPIKTQGVPVKTPSPTMEELRSPMSTPRPITPGNRPTEPRSFGSAPSLGAFQRPATATTPISPRFADSPASGIRRPATGTGSRAPHFVPTKSSGPSTFPSSTTPHDFSYIPSWTNDDQKRSIPPVVPAPRTTSRSVPSTPIYPKFKPNESVPSSEIGHRTMNNPIQAHASVSKLPPEDFHGKSRSLTMSIFPRPSSDTFRPGQSLTVYLRRAPKKKFGTIGVVLSGRLVESRNGATHEFMKVIKPVLTSAGICHDARVIGSHGDEWAIEITIPEYATCACTPGPLPLPSAGHHPMGEVIYTIQLLAEKKQLISSQETILVKFHLTKAENRGIGSQLTTRPASVKSSKGKIVFGAGHLGSIEDYSLSHHLYFYHPERVEIFYAFEVRFGPHSNLPTQLIDHLAQSAKVELRYLIGEDKKMMKGVIDHRVRGWRPIENGWMINGSLEVTDVGALISPTTSTHSSNLSQSNSLNNFKQKKYELEKELTTNKIIKELFLIVCIEEQTQVGVLNGKKLELSTVLGDTVLSKCPLRILGFQS